MQLNAISAPANDLFKMFLLGYGFQHTKRKQDTDYYTHS
jgi:hypothetical protein